MGEEPQEEEELYVVVSYFNVNGVAGRTRSQTRITGLVPKVTLQVKKTAEVNALTHYVSRITCARLSDLCIAYKGRTVQWDASGRAVQADPTFEDLGVQDGDHFEV